MTTGLNIKHCPPTHVKLEVRTGKFCEPPAYMCTPKSINIYIFIKCQLNASVKFDGRAVNYDGRAGKIGSK